MKKTWVLLVLSAMGLALMTGCTSSADTLPSPSPSASTTPSNTPIVSLGPTASMAPDTGNGTATDDPLVPSSGTVASSGTTQTNTATGVNTVADAERVSDSVTDEVEKLSELDDAEAVVAGNIALVGVKYDAQYQGGLTGRLKQMVEERVDMVDKTITTIHVTDDAEQMRKIGQLREKLDDGSITFEELQTQILEIGSSIAGGSDAPTNNSKPAGTGA